ncbi:MAG: hypothetical protein J6B77_06605 [Clostridia bacterium]|nr:hypothetical protein [Clostridia bacterium]
MLKAGFARLDITPPFGTPLAGYFYIRHTNGVLDPLEVNAVAFSDGETTAVLVAADMLGINEESAIVIRKRIAEKCGISASHILLHALHQHTSFALRPYTGLSDPVFIETLYRKFEDVSKMAIDDLSDAVAETASAETEVQLSFVRRYVMKKGPVATNPGRLHPDLVRPASDPDNTVRLIRFRRENKKDIALVNFSTHPDVIGGEKVSADWPGFARRAVERDNSNTMCIVTNGAQGDVNHIDFFKAKQWDDRYEHSRFMGETIASTVKQLWDRTVPHESGAVRGECTTLYSQTNRDGEEEYEKCKAFYAAYEAGKLDYKPTITELGYARRVINLRVARIYQPLVITVLGFADIAFVGFGGEPFTVYAENARNAAPDKFVLSLCNTNGTVGYLPSAVAFSEGGYESSGSVFTPAIESECDNAVKEMLARV